MKNGKGADETPRDPDQGREEARPWWMDIIRRRLDGTRPGSRISEGGLAKVVSLLRERLQEEPGIHASPAMAHVGYSEEFSGLISKLLDQMLARTRCADASRMLAAYLDAGEDAPLELPEIHLHFMTCETCGPLLDVWDNHPLPSTSEEWMALIDDVPHDLGLALYPDGFWLCFLGPSFVWNKLERLRGSDRKIGDWEHVSPERDVFGFNDTGQMRTEEFKFPFPGETKGCLRLELIPPENHMDPEKRWTFQLSLSDADPALSVVCNLRYPVAKDDIRETGEKTLGQAPWAFELPVPASDAPPIVIDVLMRRGQDRNAFSIPFPFHRRNNG